MNTIAIDTHKTIQKLVSKGYTAEQAEGFVEAIVESELVTKTYLDIRLKDTELRFYKALFLHGFAVVGALLAGVSILF